MSYFGKLRQSQTPSVSNLSPLVGELVGSFQDNKITPGLWRNGEIVSIVTKTAHKMRILQEKFWQVTSSHLEMQPSPNPKELLRKIKSTNSQYDGLKNTYILKCSENFNLFSRFFCGDHWLNLPLSQKDSMSPISWSDLIKNRDQTSNLIARALNSEECINSKSLTDEILFNKAQSLGYFPDLLSEQIPYKLIDLAQQKLNGIELNILHVSDGWAGCLVSAAAWAHQHPKISVNLINCDPNSQIIKSMGKMQEFLKNTLSPSNFKFNQVTGSFADFQTFIKNKISPALKNVSLSDLFQT